VLAADVALVGQLLERDGGRRNCHSAAKQQGGGNAHPERLGNSCYNQCGERDLQTTGAKNVSA
jgi:hypothetical protein